MTKAQYEIQDRSLDNTSTKQATIKSSSLDLEVETPGFNFYVTGKQDVEDLNKISDATLENLTGAHVPLWQMEKFGSAIKSSLPENTLITTDGGLEVFYYSTLSGAQEKLIEDILDLDTDTQERLKTIKNTSASSKKRRLHSALWEEIIKDNTKMGTLVSSYTHPQRKLDIPLISAPSPLLVSTEELNYLEPLYNLTRELYGEDDNGNPEPQRIALELNLKGSFLEEKENIRELCRVINRIEPEALIVRFADIRQLQTLNPSDEKNWAYLMKQIGAYSEQNGVPAIYISFSVEGPISILHGFDMFATRPTKQGKLADKPFRMKSEDMKALHEKREYLQSGKIREYDGEKGLMTREELIDYYKSKRALPYPFDVRSLGYSPDEVENMTSRSYREFAKKVSAKVYDQEVEEVKEAIQKNSVTQVRSKWSEWMADTKVFPE